jgi:O-antigen ligase
VKKAGAKLILFCAISSPIAATLIATFGGLTSQDSSAAGRLYAWYDGTQMLFSNPFFGIGMNNFIDWHGKVAHNSYIHVAAELGFFGYSMWGGALVLSCMVGYRILKDVDYSSEQNKKLQNELLINKTLFFSMIGFLITAFFLSRQFILLFFIFIGMQTASNARVMKLNPKVAEFYKASYIIKSILFSWLIVFAVYLTLKIGL